MRDSACGLGSGGQGGFSLLEVLVAFAIAGLALGVLFGGTSEALQSTAIATRYEEAVVRARSRLAAVGRDGTFVVGEQQGEDGGGFRWRTRIARVNVAPGSGQGRVPVLYSVSVAISWGEGGTVRSLQLDTSRVGFAARDGQ